MDRVANPRSGPMSAGAAACRVRGRTKGTAVHMRHSRGPGRAPPAQDRRGVPGPSSAGEAF
ncbi:hypothetical protein GCM10027440_30140 [Nocardiopsis coralliicola]